MRILIVSLFLPQGQAYHAGGRFVFELIRSLSNFHEIHLATRLAADEFSALENLRPYCKSIHPWPYAAGPRRGLLDTVRLVLNYFGFSRFADHLIRKGKYDLVQVEWVESAILIRRHGVPMLLDAHDVITKPVERRFRDAAGIGRLSGYLLYCLVQATEKAIVGRFDRVLVRSEVDRSYLEKFAPKVSSLLIPHSAGLDITDKQYAVRPRTILFLASYKYRPVNVIGALWFHREVLPLVRNTIPDVRFIIAGYGPPKELTQLTVMDPLIEVPGFVEDLDRCYKEAEVFVAPILTGGGIIVKILDALAAGTPVVTTSIGNEGIRAVPGHDLLVADIPEEFAAATIKLLCDPEGAAIIAKHGRDFVLRQFGHAGIMRKLDSVYKDLISNCNESICGKKK